MATPSIIQQNSQMPIANRNRQLIRWRVPGLGFIDMYINPQNFKINETKVTKVQRTKGGYVVQYWGEELIKISLSGTTGSSSVEGINILRQVYRAEQNAFQQVATTLADRLQQYTSTNVFTSIVDQVEKSALGSGGDAASVLANTIMDGSAIPQSLPTLGSLAMSVELFYQGWVFKGFFTSFGVSESVQQGIGVFDYTLEFTVLDRRGIRNNFTSWARTPAVFDQNGTPTSYYKADSDFTPLNYKGEK